MYCLYNAQNESISIWLYRIIEKVIAKQKLTSHPDDRNDATDDAREAFSILNKLSDKDRELMAMYYGMGLTEKEIGEELQIPARVIREEIADLLYRCDAIRRQEKYNGF